MFLVLSHAYLIFSIIYGILRRVTLLRNFYFLFLLSSSKPFSMRWKNMLTIVMKYKVLIHSGNSYLRSQKQFSDTKTDLFASKTNISYRCSTDDLLDLCFWPNGKSVTILSNEPLQNEVSKIQYRIKFELNHVISK